MSSTRQCEIGEKTEVATNQDEQKGTRTGLTVKTGDCFFNVVTNQKAWLTGFLTEKQVLRFLIFCWFSVFIPAPIFFFYMDQNEAGSRFLLAQEERPARRPRPFLPVIERSQ